MPIEITYSEARNNLASLLDRVTDDREVAVIRRRGREGVALVSEAELASLLETAHLLSSPANAERIEKALRALSKDKGEKITVDALREEFGVERKQKR